MCSTPRPKTKVTGKSGTSGSLLSTLSAEARSNFSKRANAAQDRRDQLSMKSEQAKHQHNASITSTKKTNNRPFIQTKNNFSYWLFNANINEIITMLLFGSSKRN